MCTFIVAWLQKLGLRSEVVGISSALYHDIQVLKHKYELII